MNRAYAAQGWWHVTTEGDVEGKTVTDLGKHYGYLDEIAFALGRRAYYGLHFQAIDEPKPEPLPEPVKAVNINLGIDSGTWDGPAIDRAEKVRQILKGRPVVVGESFLYASVLLKRAE